MCVQCMVSEAMHGAQAAACLCRMVHVDGLVPCILDDCGVRLVCPTAYRALALAGSELAMKTMQYCTDALAGFRVEIRVASRDCGVAVLLIAFFAEVLGAGIVLAAVHAHAAHLMQPLLYRGIELNGRVGDVRQRGGS